MTRTGREPTTKCIAAYWSSQRYALRHRRRRWMKMNDQVQHVCKSAWYHLHQIRNLQGCLTEDQLKTLINDVTSKLSTNNGLLGGAYKYLITKPQLVQKCSSKSNLWFKKIWSCMQLHRYKIFIGSQSSNASSSKFSYLCIKLDLVRAPSISRTSFFHIVHIVRTSL